ncbi:hypothetical protein OQJ18_11635 [Fluoribacter dumoffii]|nr:hypothetical protein [Fluoribacter dumoffii]MCW8387238.1 hypothetical protein [Fluoribacter dumoffii]MCW8417256.1 hypothetical protein [Fluoribacter dumoffii]MCW8454903.1 hypothetical protein [Fluoribacter dumoffii]MCW8461020.1 hypothetical protein [Fluoribacter dumoffii]MCW8484461.1 hypothetical protein [Fluoribacter dumoffii]
MKEKSLPTGEHGMLLKHFAWILLPDGQKKPFLDAVDPLLMN